jgi:hypothetical protein
VIQPGLEPGTYGLEGRCSNPTELLDQSFRAAKIAIFHEIQTCSTSFFQNKLTIAFILN